MVDVVYNVALLTVVYARFVRARTTLVIPGLLVLILAGAALAAPIAYGSIRTSWTDAMFTVMRLVSYVLFVHVPIVLTIVAARRRDVRPAAVAFVLVVAAVDAFLYEPTALDVTTVQVTARDLARPLTVALIADLQTDDPGAYERDALRTVRDRRPDLILFAGDYVHGSDRAGYERASRQLNEMLRSIDLQAPLGIYAVQGNVDSPGEWDSIFEQTAIQPISTSTTIDLPGVHLALLSFADSFDVALRRPLPSGFTIALGHGPDFALSTLDADLMLAGHTHGGQVRIPGFGPILTLSEVPREWASGLTKIDDRRTLIVSRGVGMERGAAPRLRFACRPELVFIELRPADVVEDW